MLGVISQPHRLIIRNLKKATRSNITVLFICAGSHTEKSSDAFARMYQNNMSVSDISSLIA